MPKKSASGVLARHRRLTISAAFTSVPRFIQRGVNLRGSTYHRERAAKQLGAVGENDYASPFRLLRPCWTAFLSILLLFLR
ncbi:MAG: hypothetical protein OJF51_000199 [Nitrospira sp.]|jgi:hypothetical protein|nr:MAG: hypothetical protein OJF51_000199 [Nitrospira sp.]